jgi:hypothetical protein
MVDITLNIRECVQNEDTYKVNGWRIIQHTNTEKKVGITILISDSADFSAQKLSRAKKGII